MNYNHFSMETLKVSRAWTDVLQTLRHHRCQPRWLYPSKLSVTTDRETKTHHVKTKFKQCLYTNRVILKMLEGKLLPKEVNYTQEN